MQNISIYPNPANEEVTVGIASPQPYPKEREVLLYNTVGQIMASKKMMQKETTISVKELPAGIYHVLVGGGYAGRFVKE